MLFRSLGAGDFAQLKQPKGHMLGDTEKEIRFAYVGLAVSSKLLARQPELVGRNLIEMRIRPGNPDFRVYRNRLQIDHSAEIGSLKFKPFIADEVWYSTQPTSARPSHRYDWFRNRISAGIMRELTSHLHAELFYLIQSDGLSRPGNIHAVGTLFRYTL